MIAAAHQSTQQTLALMSDDTSLILDPVHGGAVREFRWCGYDIFRPTPSAAREPLQYACFPMVPYANRVAGGNFAFGGQLVQLSTNWTGDRHPIHGEGWRAQWVVVQATPSSATLAFEGGGDEWPWTYRAEQHFDLRNDGLSMRLSVTNHSQQAMPAMLGFHPYFPEARSAQISARLPNVWEIEDGWPVTQVETPKEWRFDPPRSVNTAPFDHSFSGWDGSAEIVWPHRRLRFKASHCPSLQIYVPASEDFFCVEPQTAPWGAINRGEADIVQPGKSLTMIVDFTMGAI